MLQPAEVSIRESALLVVDAQDSFKVGPRWERRSNADFERNIAALVDGYRSAGLPVVFFLHTDGDEGFGTDSPHFKLMDFLSPRPGEPVLVKSTRNCLTSTALGPICSQTACAVSRSRASRWSSAARRPPASRPTWAMRSTSSPRRP